MAWALPLLMWVHSIDTIEPSLAAPGSRDQPVSCFRLGDERTLARTRHLSRTYAATFVSRPTETSLLIDAFSCCASLTGFGAVVRQELRDVGDGDVGDVTVAEVERHDLRVARQRVA